MAENKPEATAALAQTQEPPPSSGRMRGARISADGEFVIAARATLASATQPYEHRAGEPLYRPLKIFTMDPSVSRLEGAVATLKVPFERLQPGPRGAVFEVGNFDGHQHNQRVDLDDPLVVINQGLDPTPSDPRFHQQMVYAVASSVYAVFRNALGRHVAWSFPARQGESTPRLLLQPHALEGTSNAYYDPTSGSIQFGYFRAAEKVAGRNLPRGWVFTCLSHDIIAHEVTHALLDGLRTHFTVPTNADVLAFHEALADLVAVFQHFSYRDVVRIQMAKCRANLQVPSLLTELAGQFARTTGGSLSGEALRSAVQHRVDEAAGRERQPLVYGQHVEPHALGSVLVGAVFQAFATVFERKTRRFVQLATGGSGILPPGELSPHLIDILAEQAARLASHFLSICIRAVDYCPPVDLLFGEYLRAMITADHALVPDDPWGYREAMVDAFRSHGIHPTDVGNLSEDALLWRAPEQAMPNCPDLGFSALKFRGDPLNAAGPEELDRQADALGRYITAPGRSRFFGIVTRAEAARLGLQVGLPTIQSVRATRRVGPVGQVVFDLVAEVTQARTVRTERGQEFAFLGGSTVVLDPSGNVRFIVGKGTNSTARLERQLAFMRSPHGKTLWMQQAQAMVPRQEQFRLLHGSPH
ncbi:hypothetical protein ACQUZK_08810 [Streptococcus pyogenes]|uniref:hypothetical protein n=1 Tax=Streptococcus pyogenes TaxID=1314 RepID=UPI003DA0F04D